MISELLEIMKAESLDEIEVRNLFSSIRLVRRQSPVVDGRIESSGGPEMVESTSGTPVVEDEKTAAAEISDIEAEESGKPDDLTPSDISEDQNFEQIVSPMVGTFYLAPGPGAEPFVKVGQYVEIGQTVCVIEAMKLMNEIESDKKGKICKVLVKDSRPVEFGQPLFLVEPA
ncbi:MAG: acetyl-CoA carboxylase biotin carboxyl carrier protein [Candidatus Krumholzibacteriota bacterium]|nr:acetyl-CoA carboxylase biotin carboxyl carrier protein [Candidatus Krumholzibacteriota bacterium]